MVIAHRLSVAFCFALVLLALQPVSANEPAAVSGTQPAEAAAAAGLLPVPDYSGDIWTRAFLSGDWNRVRTDWANIGIQLDVNFTQTVQSVVDGGREYGTKYGGTLDYNGKLDLMKMGVMQGALVQFRAETRYGESANDIAGPLLPVNSDAFFPLTNDLDDDVPFTITSLNYTQFLSEKFAVTFGKIDTIDGDANEFASGRGTSQFLNANFLFSSTTLLVAPYSTLAAGVLVMPIKQLTVTSIVYNIDDSSTTTGFEDFGKGTVWLTEAKGQYQIFNLPGGQNLGFAYGFDSEFTRLDKRFTFHRGQGIDVPDTDETWTVYWSGWQYMWEAEHSDAPVDVGNGTPDRQGIGLFWRVGVADEDTNPIEWVVSGGVGGRGMIPTRDHDAFGVGYFRTKLQTFRLTDRVGVADHAEGFEAFYNIEITPAAHLTFDIQVVDSPLPDIDSAVVLGARLNLKF